MYIHNYKLHLHGDLYLVVSETHSQHIPLMTKPSDKLHLMR